MKGSPGEIEEAFREAGIAGLPAEAFARLASYLNLMVRWNAKVNLTALRIPSQIIRRHLVECAFVAQKLPKDIVSLMDYGSGAGLPGVVIALCRPEVRVTLAEAQGRKAAFLREVARSLELECEIFDRRVEEMPSERRFDAVSMRAVEKMELAIPVALLHLKRYLVLLTTDALAVLYRGEFQELAWMEGVRLPNSRNMLLEIGCSTWNNETEKVS